MFDAQCDLAALVYDGHDDPDTVLREFANELNARGFRAVGMVQAGQCADSSLSAVLVHTGETLLLAQDFDPNAQGCRLDLDRLNNAAVRVADALDIGADLLIVNRFGKRERDGKGLTHLIQRALDADTPVVIAVSSAQFDEWVKYSDGMSVKLACESQAVDAWWRNVSTRVPRAVDRHRTTICEVLK